MKKYLRSLLVVLLVIPVAMLSVGCGDNNTTASIEVTGQLTKAVYAVGEAFDPSGLEIKVTKNNGDKVDKEVVLNMVSGAALDSNKKFKSTHLGTQTLTVTYDGKTDDFTVTVAETEPLLVPTGFSVSQASRLAQWNSVDHAKNYTVKVVNSGNNQLAEEREVNTTTFSLRALPLAAGEYKVSVRANGQLSGGVIYGNSAFTQESGYYVEEGLDGTYRLESVNGVEIGNMSADDAMSVVMWAVTKTTVVNYITDYYQTDTEEFLSDMSDRFNGIFNAAEYLASELADGLDKEYSILGVGTTKLCDFITSYFSKVNVTKNSNPLTLSEGLADELLNEYLIADTANNPMEKEDLAGYIYEALDSYSDEIGTRLEAYGANPAELAREILDDILHNCIVRNNVAGFLKNYLGGIGFTGSDLSNLSGLAANMAIALNGKYDISVNQSTLEELLTNSKVEEVKSAWGRIPGSGFASVDDFIDFIAVVGLGSAGLDKIDDELINLTSMVIISGRSIVIDGVVYQYTLGAGGVMSLDSSTVSGVSAEVSYDGAEKIIITLDASVCLLVLVYLFV